MGRTEEHRQLGRRLHEPGGALKVGPGSVEEDVIPDARPSREPCKPPLLALQLDDDNNRQARRVSLSQQVRSNDRLIPLRRSVVGNEKVVVSDAIERIAESRRVVGGFAGSRF